MGKFNDLFSKARPAWAGLINAIFQQLDTLLTGMDDGTRPIPNISVTGGTVDDTEFGADAPDEGNFTTIDASGDLNLGSCFHTKLNYLQTVATLDTDLVEFDEALLDNNSDFDLASHLFQPSVAGWYLLIAHINCNAGITKEVIVSIAKNGTTVAPQQRISSGTFSEAIPFMTVQQANGSTDYFEVYFYNGHSSSVVIQGNFMGTRIR